MRESLRGRVKIEEIRPAHTDRRREIIEWYDRREGQPTLSNQKVINIFEGSTSDPMILGNHYHEDIELFYMLSGVIDELILEDADTGERMVEYQLQSGTMIFVPGRVTHVLTFSKPSVLLVANENPFNPVNLIPHLIKK